MRANAQDEEVLQFENAELYYTKAKRDAAKKSFIRWGMLNVLLLSYILIITFSFYN